MPRWLLVAVAAVFCAVVGVVVFASPDHHTAGPRDDRPITLPASFGGWSLSTDSMAVLHNDAMVPILTKMYGDRVSTSAVYGTPDVPVSHPKVYLLTGRGTMDHAKAGDVRVADSEHRVFGDVTCAYLKYHGQVLPSLDVCWYSSPTFSVSATFLGDKDHDSAWHAQALAQVLPVLRGDPAVSSGSP